MAGGWALAHGARPKTTDQLHTVGLTSTHSAGSKTKLLERGCTFSGVVQSERHSLGDWEEWPVDPQLSGALFLDLLVHKSPSYQANQGWWLPLWSYHQICSCMSLTIRWREEQSCQLIITWWWVRSDGRGDCQRDLVNQNGEWGGTEQAWWRLWSIGSTTLSSGSTSHSSQGRLGTWNLNGPCSKLTL